MGPGLGPRARVRVMRAVQPSTLQSHALSISISLQAAPRPFEPRPPPHRAQPPRAAEMDTYAHTHTCSYIYMHGLSRS